MSPGETPAREGDPALGGASPVALDRSDALGGLGLGALGGAAPPQRGGPGGLHSSQLTTPRLAWPAEGPTELQRERPGARPAPWLCASPGSSGPSRPPALPSGPGRSGGGAAARPRWSSFWSTCGMSDARRPCQLGRHQGRIPEKHTLGAGHVAGAPTESESETVQGAGVGSVHRRPRGAPSSEGVPSRIPSVVPSAPILRVPGACRVRH